MSHQIPGSMAHVATDSAFRSYACVAAFSALGLHIPRGVCACAIRCNKDIQHATTTSHKTNTLDAACGRVWVVGRSPDRDAQMPFYRLFRVRRCSSHAEGAQCVWHIPSSAWHVCTGGCHRVGHRLFVVRLMRCCTSYVGLLCDEGRRAGLHLSSGRFRNVGTRCDSGASLVDRVRGMGHFGDIDSVANICATSNVPDLFLRAWRIWLLRWNCLPPPTNWMNIGAGRAGLFCQPTPRHHMAGSGTRGGGMCRLGIVSRRYPSSSRAWLASRCPGARDRNVALDLAKPRCVVLGSTFRAE